MSNLKFSAEDNKAVDWCEKNYPELTTEYKKIMMNQYVLFCKKHRNYGTGNINVGTNLETENDLYYTKPLTYQIENKLKYNITNRIGIGLSGNYIETLNGYDYSAKALITIKFK